MKLLLLVVLLMSQLVFAQTEGGTSVADIQKIVNESLASKWYERIQLRGYAHFRYNRLFETNRKLKSGQTDASIGDKQGFFMRRARLTFYGDVNDRVFIYIQPDYSTNATNTQSQQSYFQIRDAYFDYHLTENKEWRTRLGISKVPFGFDNMQSSSNRGPLDRSDAINSGAPNERDTGMFLMYAPSEIRARFKELANSSLKGSGDYGMLAIGAFNGQSLNRQERNNDLHRAIRLTYPMKLANGQFIEASVQAYEGKYNTTDQAKAPQVGKDFYDQRTAYTLVYYPQPIGFQLEYNHGTGPEFDKKVGTTRASKLEGGYAQVYYNLNIENHRIFPYVRSQKYKGGKKLATNAEYNSVEEWEIGTEWQPHAAFELTAAYAMMNRLTQSSNDPADLTGFKNHQQGNLLRLQAQFNY